MKFFLFVFCMVTAYSISKAQTNIFQSTGNVGIGTTTPGNLLTVVKDTESSAVAFFDSRNSTYGYGIALNTEANNASSYAFHAFRGGDQANSLLWLGTTGNLGLGTRTPGAKLSFTDVTNNSVDGITWHDSSPTSYGIHRTVGAWASPDYQQLRVSWTTGIVLDPGSEYGKSYVDVKGSGLRVSSGSVGIGTVNTRGHMLAVAGTAIAESMTVKLQGGWPDYVFDVGHKLPTLKETEDFILENKHLPGIPKAKDVASDGINLEDMNARLLQKIEELTLHLIEQGKTNEKQTDEIMQLQLSNKYLLDEIKRNGKR